MQRQRTRRGNGYHRKRWESGSPRRRRNELKNQKLSSSFAVIRSLDSESIPLFRRIFHGTESGAISVRGKNSSDAPPRMSLLMKTVVNIEAPGEYDLNEVHEILHENIPSLSKPLSFPVKAIAKLITKNATHVAVVPDPETNEVLSHERGQIIDNLGMRLYDFRFFGIIPNGLPHITGVSYRPDIEACELDEKRAQAYRNLEQIHEQVDLPTLELAPFKVI